MVENPEDMTFNINKAPLTPKIIGCKGGNYLVSIKHLSSINFKFSLAVCDQAISFTEDE